MKHLMSKRITNVKFDVQGQSCGTCNVFCSDLCVFSCRGGCNIACDGGCGGLALW